MGCLTVKLAVDIFRLERFQAPPFARGAKRRRYRSRCRVLSQPLLKWPHSKQHIYRNA